MTPEAFVRSYRHYAEIAARGTGLSRWTILAQWAAETGWGESRLARQGNNLAGITGIRGGKRVFLTYPSLDAFVAAYIATMRNGYYGRVLASANQPIEKQLLALGNSPWAAGHYRTGGQNGGLLLSVWQRIERLVPKPTEQPEEPKPPESQTPAASDHELIVWLVNAVSVLLDAAGRPTSKPPL